MFKQLDMKLFTILCPIFLLISTYALPLITEIFSLFSRSASPWSLFKASDTDLGSKIDEMSDNFLDAGLQ